MLVVTPEAQPHLDEAKRFAAATGQAAQLQEQLDHLDRFFDGDRDGSVRCLLLPDFAPHSFTWACQRKTDQGWATFYNGGLIYFGAKAVGSGAPTYCTQIDPQQGWSIHS